MNHKIIEDHKQDIMLFSLPCFLDLFPRIFQGWGIIRVWKFNVQ